MIANDDSNVCVHFYICLIYRLWVIKLQNVIKTFITSYNYDFTFSVAHNFYRQMNLLLV